MFKTYVGTNWSPLNILCYMHSKLNIDSHSVENGRESVRSDTLFFPPVSLSQSGLASPPWASRFFFHIGTHDYLAESQSIWRAAELAPTTWLKFITNKSLSKARMYRSSLGSSALLFWIRVQSARTMINGAPQEDQHRIFDSYGL